MERLLYQANKFRTNADGSFMGGTSPTDFSDCDCCKSCCFLEWPCTFAEASRVSSSPPRFQHTVQVDVLQTSHGYRISDGVLVVRSEWEFSFTVAASTYQCFSPYTVSHSFGSLLSRYQRWANFGAGGLGPSDNPVCNKNTTAGLVNVDFRVYNANQDAQIVVTTNTTIAAPNFVGDVNCLYPPTIEVSPKPISTPTVFLKLWGTSPFSASFSYRDSFNKCDAYAMPPLGDCASAATVNCVSNTSDSSLNYVEELTYTVSISPSLTSCAAPSPLMAMMSDPINSIRNWRLGRGPALDSPEGVSL